MSKISSRPTSSPYYLHVLSFMLGISLLLPWNALLKSLPYVMSRVPEEMTGVAPLLLTLTFTGTNCVSLIGLTIGSGDTALVKKFTRRRGTGQVLGAKLYGGLVSCSGLLVLACVTPILDLFNPMAGRSYAHLMLYWGIFMLSGLGICLLQRSVYPIMNLLPGKSGLMSVMLMGQASVGITASVGSFLMNGNSGNNSNEINRRSEALMALGYFCVSCVMLAGTAVIFYNYHLKVEEEGAEEKADELKVEVRKLSSFSSTMKLINPWQWLIAANFGVTLSIFPAVLTSSGRPLSDSSSSFTGMYFIPLTFLTFDIFDLVGKSMPTLWRRSIHIFGPKSRMARGFPAGRVLFVVLLLLTPNLRNWKSGKFPFWWDVVYFVLVALLAWSSGWVSVICLINAPLNAQMRKSDGKDGGKVVSASENDRIGSLMGLSISIGLLAGCLLSFVLRWILMFFL